MLSPEDNLRERHYKSGGYEHRVEDKEMMRQVYHEFGLDNNRGSDYNEREQEWDQKINEEGLSLDCRHLFFFSEYVSEEAAEVFNFCAGHDNRLHGDQFSSDEILTFTFLDFEVNFDFDVVFNGQSDFVGRDFIVFLRFVYDECLKVEELLFKPISNPCDEFLPFGVRYDFFSDYREVFIVLKVSPYYIHREDEKGYCEKERHLCGDSCQINPCSLNAHKCGDEENY